MLIGILLALLLGIVIGTITGLTPGIHINLVAVFITTIIAGNITDNNLALMVCITSIALTHTFIDFIPSIYLGAPEEDTFLVVLPGHELLKEGKGHEAVMLALVGCLISTIVVLIISPLIIHFSPILQQNIIKYIPFILIFVSLYLILREDEWHIALIVFIISGILGFLTLNEPVKEPLLPLLSGLFGASGLITGINMKTKLPKQEITSIRELKISKKDILKTIGSIALISPPFSILPALGSGYASLISGEILNLSRRNFIMVAGAMGTAAMAISFLAIYSLNKARTGAAAAITELAGKLSLHDLIYILGAAFISSIFAFCIGIYLSKKIARGISSVNYGKVSIIILAILILVILIFSNPLGLLVFTTATALGIFTIQKGIKRTTLMGCLLIPTIIYYMLH